MLVYNSGFKIFGGITPFNTYEQLLQNNIAVGIVIGAIFIGLGIVIDLAVGMGLISKYV